MRGDLLEFDGERGLGAFGLAEFALERESGIVKSPRKRVDLPPPWPLG
jgi:hypothetical protein